MPPVSPWTCHQKRAHRLSAYAEQPPVGSQYVGEGIPRINSRPAPRYDETSDDDNYQPGIRTQTHYGTREPALAHPDVTRGCQEQLSRRDWYEAPARPAPAPLPRQEECGAPRQPVVDWGPARSHPQVRWLKCRTFKVMGV